MTSPRTYIKTYIMITVLNGNINQVFYHLIDMLPTICLAGAKDNDLFLAVPDGGCGFSLKQLKQSVSEVATAKIAIGDIYDDSEVIFYNLSI